MPLDRQDIERRDFPIARRGYDIDAVNEHLALVANECEASGRGSQAAKAGSVASNAAQQVRVIVEVAEATAADIVREAELESRQLRQDAREEAERLRTDAGQEARAHVASVAEVAQALLDRVEGMDQELGTVLEGLRSGVRRVTADLVLLQGAVGEFRAGGSAASGRKPESAEKPPALEGSREAVPNTDADEDQAAADDPAVANHAAAVDDRDDEGIPALAPSEEEGARMIALHMALNGVPRKETQRHLEDNFDVEDIESVLDDAYMRAGE